MSCATATAKVAPPGFHSTESWAWGSEEGDGEDDEPGCEEQTNAGCQTRAFGEGIEEGRNETARSGGLCRGGDYYPSRPPKSAAVLPAL